MASLSPFLGALLDMSSAAAALAAVALLASGCGTPDSGSGSRPQHPTTAQSAAPWTSREANAKLTEAVRGFSTDIDELYRQRNEQHSVAVYAVQCDELVPELSDFLRFLDHGRWPPSVRPAVDHLAAAQVTYDKGLRVCADALDEKRLLAGFRQMDTAPIDTLLTRLRTALSAGAT
jgi:hypothetical protein